MATLNILNYPDPRLHKIATSVGEITDKHKKLIKDMAETMYAAPGIGLAATQVDFHERIIVIDTSEEKNNLLVLINPEIIEKSGEQVCEEGCLSVPGISTKIRRYTKAKVTATGLDGNEFTEEGEGLYARALQHEYDHIEGMTIVNRMGSAAKIAHRRQIKKLQESASKEQ